jgi:DedD protein
MDEGAKRRLVGAAVLVALIVIFVPMLLDNADHGDLGEPIVIPDEPQMAPGDEDTEAPTAGLTAEDLTPPLPIPEPPPGAVLEPPLDAPVEPQPQPLPEPTVAPGPQPVPPGTLSWVVQVASLGSPEAAKGLRDRLRAKGYTAFVEEATVNGKRYFRVRVGPEVERARADGLAAELQSETGSKPLVQRYP